MKRLRGARIHDFFIASFVISCFLIGPVVISPGIRAAPGIHSQTYDIINSGNPPIASGMLYPNQTQWTDPRVACLIITNASFVPVFQPLADLKTSRGCYAEIITTKSIYSNASFNGTVNDKCAWIRNAIRYYHDVKGTEFVILGGDVNIIPIRYVYNSDPTTDFSGNYSTYMPTDYYYAALKGTWDEDHPGIYGEMQNATNPVDDIDWTPDVFVGRFPVNSIAEARAMVQKDISYETSPPNGAWVNTGLFAGAVSQYSIPAYQPSVDEAQLSDFIIDSYLSSMTPERVYHCTPDYTPDEPYAELNASSLARIWDDGAAIVNMAGHGSPTSFDGQIDVGQQALPEYMTANNAMALYNNGTLPFVYIFSCDSGAFDVDEHGYNPYYNCLSEALVRNPAAGAIAVVSAMRTTLYDPSDHLFEALNEGQDRFFWREFFLGQDYQPGRCLYLSKLAYIQQYMQKYPNICLEDKPEYLGTLYYTNPENYRGNLLTYNLLGDPEIYIYTSKPQAFAGNVVNATEYMGDNMAVQIKTVSGGIVPNATILLNGSGYYIVAHADELGLASLQIPRDPRLVGKNLSVTFYGHDMKTRHETITIIADTVPPASLDVETPVGIVDYRGQFSINATGIDTGSGLRHAFVVFVDSTGATLVVNPMNIARVAGNETDFRYTCQAPLSPGSTMLFYVVAYDAGGNYIIAKATTSQYYAVQISSRAEEETMFYTVVLGIPIAAIIIVTWMFVSRKRHLNELDK